MYKKIHSILRKLVQTTQAYPYCESGYPHKLPLDLPGRCEKAEEA